MKFEEQKCPNCGAPIQFLKNEKSVSCEYCRATFSNTNFEEPPKDKQQIPNPNLKDPFKIDVFDEMLYTKDYNKNTNNTRKPKVKKNIFGFISELNIFWTVVLFCCAVWPGVLYLVYKYSKYMEN